MRGILITRVQSSSASAAGRPSRPTCSSRPSRSSTVVAREGVIKSDLHAHFCWTSCLWSQRAFVHAFTHAFVHALRIASENSSRSFEIHHLKYKIHHLKYKVHQHFNAKLIMPNTKLIILNTKLYTFIAPGFPCTTISSISSTAELYTRVKFAITALNSVMSFPAR